MSIVTFVYSVLISIVSSFFVLLLLFLLLFKLNIRQLHAKKKLQKKLKCNNLQNEIITGEKKEC